MPAFKGAKKEKNEFADLSEEFTTKIDGGDEQVIKNAIAEAALLGLQTKILKDDDQDLASKVDQAKEAGAVYKEIAKSVNLKIKYARQVLKARGLDVGEE